MARNLARSLSKQAIAFLTFGSGTIGVIIIWWIAARLELINPLLLPGPFATIATLISSTFQGNLLEDFGNTLYRTLYAFAIASAFGIPLGVIIGSSQKVYRAFEFLIDFFRSTPATAMFPLFLVIFGIDDFSKIAVAAFAGFLVIFFNVAYGVMNARKTRILAAKVMGAPLWRIFFDVMFFETVPQMFIGLRTAVSLVLVIIIVAEMFVGSNDGMGHRIIDAQIIYDMEQMYASIIATGIMGFGLNLFFLKAEQKFVHWK
ncbi:MAG: ABC transporter permease [Cyanobacteria bacterium J06642_2]